MRDPFQFSSYFSLEPQSIGCLLCETNLTLPFPIFQIFAIFVLDFFEPCTLPVYQDVPSIPHNHIEGQEVSKRNVRILLIKPSTLEVYYSGTTQEPRLQRSRTQITMINKIGERKTRIRRQTILQSRRVRKKERLNVKNKPFTILKASSILLPP